MKPIRTAILGLGRIAWRLEEDALRYHPCTHWGSLKSLNRKAKVFELVGACDINPAALSDFGRFSKQKCVFGLDAGEVLRKSRPELVIVAASLEAHETLVKQAVSCGAKAIVLEKPPAASHAAVRKMLKLCKDIPVWVNFERRYHPHYARIRELVASATNERIRAVRGRVLAGAAPGGPGSGPLLHDAIHWIDLLLWMAGSPAAAEARQLRRSSSSAEHTSIVRFDYPEFSATLESGGRRKYFEFEMEIDLDTERIYCGNSGFRLLKRKSSGRYSNFFELAPAVLRLPAWKNPWINLYTEVRSYLRERGSMMTSSLLNAAEAMRWIDAVDVSAASSKRK